MEWLIILTGTVVGAIVNRFRGGGIILLPTETKVPDHKRTQIRRITWVAVMSTMCANPVVAIPMFLLMLTGWGFPVSACLGKNQSPWEPEFRPLDKLTLWLVGNNNAKLYGLVWLSFYGLMTGAIVGLVTMSLWPLLWVLMGACYKIANDWERGEIIYGALQGFTLSLILTTILW